MEPTSFSGNFPLGLLPEGVEEENDEVLNETSSEECAAIASLVQEYMLPEDDDIMHRALKVVILEHNTSPRYLQMRLKIGCNRAVELLEIMKARGIIGSPSARENKYATSFLQNIDIN